MEKPKIVIQLTDGCDQDPPDSVCFFTTLNGHSQPSLLFREYPIVIKNDLEIGLSELLESVYARGFKDGEKEGKNQVQKLINWAKS